MNIGCISKKTVSEMRSSIRSLECALRKKDKNIVELLKETDTLRKCITSQKASREGLESRIEELEKYETAVFDFAPVAMTMDARDKCYRTVHTSFTSIVTERYNKQFALLTGVNSCLRYGKFPILPEYLKFLLQCGECQKKLYMHRLQFTKSSIYPDNYYVSCECGNNVGKLFHTPFEAVAAWNEYCKTKK